MDRLSGNKSNNGGKKGFPSRARARVRRRRCDVHDAGGDHSDGWMVVEHINAIKPARTIRRHDPTSRITPEDPSGDLRKC